MQVKTIRWSLLTIAAVISTAITALTLDVETRGYSSVSVLNRAFGRFPTSRLLLGGSGRFLDLIVFIQPSFWAKDNRINAICIQVNSCRIGEKFSIVPAEGLRRF